MNAPVCFCIPVFNDWNAVMLVLEQLDEVAPRIAGVVHVLLVDDGSTDPVPSELSFAPRHIGAVHILPLRRNLGHQRAIAIGLTFMYEQRQGRAVVVMDADGEDAPRDVPKLLEELERLDSRNVVFAARARRSEGWKFALGYRAYKLLHRVLTGRKVEVGNFSVLPWQILERLVCVSETWNHYAAAVHKARLPVAQVAIPRAKRLVGESHMNLMSLVAHGLSAISVYGDVVGVRMLCAAAALIALSFLGIAATVGVSLFTELALPSWTTAITALLSLLIIGLSALLMMALLFLLQSRERYSFLPLRDYRHYVLPERALLG